LPPMQGGLFDVTKTKNGMRSVIGDIRDYENLRSVFEKSAPEVVFHLAAQPLVLDSYSRPQYTYETNVMGTVNLLECIRLIGGTRSAVVITTDKVYRNVESSKGYAETDTLGGFDPYSSSKACTELVVDSYNASFFRTAGVAVSTARAGNVIGGGDVAKNRVIPDCVRAATANEIILVRNPRAVRPYQHVLEPLAAYLEIARRQYENPSLADCYNIGPNEADCVTTETLVDIFCKKWGNNVSQETVRYKNAPHESGLLYLDCTKIGHMLNWQPKWNTEIAIEKTVEWEKAHLRDEGDICLAAQIEAYMAL